MGSRFRILGPLEVEGAAALGGPKQRTLLARLLVEPNRVVPYERLVDDLWPEGPPETARHSLQVYVSTLRRTLGDGCLRAESGGYVLELEPDDLDAVRFEGLVARGAGLLRRGEADAARRALGEALELWHGPALGGAGPALEPERARLEEQRLSALEERIEADLELGRHGDVVAELEGLVREEPLRERPRRQLMLALYRCGRQADALDAYRDTRRVLVEELGLEPSPESRELEAAILRQDASLSVEPPELRARRHLPAPATALVGRAKELSELVALLREESPRLLTLTGAGGSGKTRLALQAASAVVDRFTDGVFFVDLAPLSDPQLVASTIASRLGVEESAGRPLLESLKEHLRDRRLLLLLDNFEHVDEAAPVVSELLAEASGLKALVTSRALLHLYGEHEYPVPPLAEEEAVELFATRARAVRSGFEVDGVRPHVVELCQSLDGLPLAIELAAARSGELSPAEMLAVLPHRLDLATQGARDLPARQQTLRATIEWSYGLLDESEQALFARLAVFAGGCSLEAAQAVCEADLSELASLVEKSLVLETELPDGEAQFSMLETVREFAAARLRETPRADEVARRHTAYFVTLTEQADRALEAGGESVEWLDRLEREQDNLRAALDRAAEARDGELGLRLGVTLGRFWEWRSHLREGLDRFDQALQHAHAAPAPLRARALMRAGVFAHLLGEFARARERLEEALALARSSGDETVEANALRNLGSLAKDAGDHARAQAMHEEARAISAKSGDQLGVHSSLVNLSDVALSQHDYARAEALAEESVLLARELGHEARELAALINLGLASLHRGRDEQARATFREAVRLSLALRWPECLVVGLEGLASLDAEQGDPLRAARLMGAADALLERAGYVLEAGERELHEQTLATVGARLDRQDFESAWREGRALSLEEAADEALDSVA